MANSSKGTRAFIIANGEADLPGTLDARDSDLIVCADGGSNHLEKLGVKPHIIVGDLDSISQSLLAEFEKNGVTVKKYPREKDASDLELAIEEAVKAGPDEIVCVAVFGGRPDHALTNVSLLGRFAERKIKISILGATWRAQFVTADQPAELNGKTGDLFSLVPLSARIEHATVSGAKWPLAGTDLTWGNSLTLSNVFEQDQVNVSVKAGLMLVFHMH